MKRFDQQWQALTMLARQGGDTREVAAPYGFATRVAAQGLALPPAGPWELFERVALRGLLVAGALGMAAFAFNLTSSHNQMDPWEEYAGSDIVAAEINFL